MINFFRRKKSASDVQPALTRESALELLQSNQAFGDLVFFAIDHGISSIEDGSGPLVPFVFEQRGESRKAHRFLVDRLEECVAAARWHISKMKKDIDSYAFAYDGYTTLEGVKYDVIFVEAELRSHPGTILMAQRYLPKSSEQSFKCIGNPMFHGVAPSTLSPT